MSKHKYCVITQVIAKNPKEAIQTAINYYKGNYLINRAVYVKNAIAYGYKYYDIYGKKVGDK